MPPPIPFTWMTPALLAGCKSVIRRDWLEDGITTFHVGQFVLAYDFLPSAGGVPVAVIRLIDDPVVERSSNLTDIDYEEEGFGFLERFSFPLPGHFYPLRDFFYLWKSMDIPLCVLRFELIELTPEGKLMAEKLFKWGCTVMNDK